MQELSCAARDGAEMCHYRITWTPRPTIFRRFKEFINFRFRDQRAIISHMEESQKNLQQQYNEILVLKDRVQASRDFLNHVLENVNAGILWLDPEGKIIFSNAAFREITEKTEKELTGSLFWSLLSGQQSEMDYRLLFMGSQEKKDVPQAREFEFVRASGEQRVGDTTFTWITEGSELPGFLVTVRDITERKKMERELFALESRYRSLYENSPALITAIDPDGRFIYANPAMETEIGYSEAELKGMHFRDLVAPDADFDVDRLVKGRLDQGPRLQEVHFKTKKGGWKAVALNTYPIIDPGGALRGIAGIGVDVTETKRLNEQLVQTQRMDLLGQLAGGLAHDFNNILLSISGYSQLLLKKGLSPDLQEYARALVKASERAGELTRQLLTFSRGDIGKRETFSLNAIAREVRQLLVPVLAGNITVQSFVPDGEIRIKGDPGKVHQCLLNLCLNARDAIGKEKEGVISIRLKEKSENGYVVIEVRDTGPGIPPDVIEKIFDPFFSTKGRGKGTGLGLSVVYGIVRSHNGRISVESRPGEGALFRVELPALEEPMPSPDRAGNGPALQAKKEGLVMLVDDELLVRGVCEDMLKSAGFEVVQFGSGEDAVAWFRSNSPGVRFAVADIMLPEMDGVEMVERLRRIRSDLPVIWMTGFISPGLKKPPETDPVLIKPFTSSDFMHSIRDAESRGRRP